MIQKIIDDVSKALEHQCFTPALMAALTLPDICGNVEYPGYTSKKRYVSWFDKYIPHGLSPFWDNEKGKNLPELNGEIVYLLRCSLLHEGTINFEKTKIKCIENRFDYFELYTEPFNENDIYLTILRRSPTSKAMIVGIRGLCMLLTRTASAYYDQYSVKFHRQDAIAI